MANNSVYILSNRHKTVLYIGVTNNLQRRLYEHQNESKGFVARYRCWHLVYHEQHHRIVDAIVREKQLKRWNRAKKEALIKGFNPDWRFIELEDLG